MIVTLNGSTTKDEVSRLCNQIENLDLSATLLSHRNDIALVLDGAITSDKVNSIRNWPQVAATEEIHSPYKKASKQWHPEDSIIEVGNIKIGGGHFAMIGGPCSIETYNQLEKTAAYVKESGGNALRGGAFKPRTSPYSFQGLGKDGLDMMHEIGQKYDMPIVSEVMAISQIELFEDVDMFQVGARNMQNFDLLKELGKTNKPILLKRGLSATIQEWLMSAEYIMSEGNENVILCERGIRTFETETRNTQDLSAIAVVKQLSHLPVVIDPSHAAGRRDIIESLSLAAVAAGADGLIIETHPEPERASSDGEQSLYPEQYRELTEKVWKLHQFMKQINTKN
ncbi:3-deoxy-7-phosphoheptulonate synthase [Jeotgalibaca ciconiae]|uniref:3-deoxy-7-phosphoheptulonate synthase n=1 Tax=Jeotgalibaca ciconiae TaxID=2496265 RepID=A0A3S9H7M2_9LACT|nr:3-deoxy-7-phosphoheptulonate synthase [Jeotgalibaca ciconiae]AZP03281.1 3-deoxy-7-phosphoheptulonate synthase [Jeotgalibaca ciconiae]HJB23606.1 3-deoxy-7-phosphoheptulonate synthase [Candidatus Jeotgalibaca pullicola]